MSAAASPPAADLSLLPLLLAAMGEAIRADLGIEEVSLLLFIAHKGGISAKSMAGHTYRRPREALRKAGLIEWRVWRVELTEEGAALVAKITAAAAEKLSIKEAAGV